MILARSLGVLRDAKAFRMLSLTLSASTKLTSSNKTDHRPDRPKSVRKRLISY